jgi:large repetitive protein
LTLRLVQGNLDPHMMNLRIVRRTWVATALLVAVLPACVSSGSDQTSEISEEVALPPPTNLAMTIIGPTRINLTWDASPGATFYILNIGPTPGSEVFATSAAGTSFPVKGRTPGTQYCFTLQNVNASSEISLPSNEVCGTTPTASTTPAPATISATAISSSRISLTWSAVPTATVYEVFQGLTGTTPTYLTTVRDPTTTIVSAGLLPATSYSYFVQAIAPAGRSASSATVSATTFGVGTEGYWKFDEVTGTTTNEAAGNGRNGTLVSSAFSNANKPPVFRKFNRSHASISTDTTSKVSVAYNSELRLATADWTVAMWVNPSGDTTFAGMRNASCGSVNWIIGVSAANGLFFQDATTTRASNIAIPNGQWTQIALTATGATLTFYVNGLQVAAVPYAPVGRAANLPLAFGHAGDCAGAAVLIDEVRMLSRALSASEVGVLGIRPPAPTGMSVSNTCSTVQLPAWNALTGAGTVQRYYLSRGTAAGNETLLTSVNGNLTSFSVPALTPATQYSYFIQAEINDLSSLPSNEAILTTLPAPAAPSGITASAVSNSRIQLTWAAVSNATSYQILISTDGGATYSPQTSSLAAGSITIANLLPSTTYFFVIRSVDACTTQSVNSTPVSVTTPA